MFICIDGGGISMVTDKVSYSECVGCSACANICPKGIITIKLKLRTRISAYAP